MFHRWRDGPIFISVNGRGLEDHEVEAERLAAWSEMTVGACEVRMFPGGHFYLNSSQAAFLQTFAGDLLRLRLQN